MEKKMDTMVDYILSDSKLLNSIQKLVRKRLCNNRMVLENEHIDSVINRTIDETIQELKLEEIILETLPVGHKKIPSQPKILPNFSDSEPQQVKTNARRSKKKGNYLIPNFVSNNDSEGSLLFKDNTNRNISTQNNLQSTKLNLNDTIRFETHPNFTFADEDNVQMDSLTSALSDCRSSSSSNDWISNNNQSNPDDNEINFSNLQDNALLNTDDELIFGNHSLLPEEIEGSDLIIFNSEIRNNIFNRKNSGRYLRHQSNDLSLFTIEPNDESNSNSTRKVQFCPMLLKDTFTRDKTTQEEMSTLYLTNSEAQLCQVEKGIEDERAKELNMTWLDYMLQRTDMEADEQSNQAKSMLHPFSWIQNSHSNSNDNDFEDFEEEEEEYDYNPSASNSSLDILMQGC